MTEYWTEIADAKKSRLLDLKIFNIGILTAAPTRQIFNVTTINPPSISIRSLRGYSEEHTLTRNTYDTLGRYALSCQDGA
jgi:hypothetical protein